MTTSSRNLGSKLVLSINRSDATQWVLHTCPIIGLLPLMIMRRMCVCGHMIWICNADNDFMSFFLPSGVRTLCLQFPAAPCDLLLGVLFGLVVLFFLTNTTLLSPHPTNQDQGSRPSDNKCRMQQFLIPKNCEALIEVPKENSSNCLSHRKPPSG